MTLPSLWLIALSQTTEHEISNRFPDGDVWTATRPHKRYSTSEASQIVALMAAFALHKHACHIDEMPRRYDGIVQVDPVAGRLVQAVAGERDLRHVVHVRVLVQPHPAAAAGREERVVQPQERQVMLHRRVLTVQPTRRVLGAVRIHQQICSFKHECTERPDRRTAVTRISCLGLLRSACARSGMQLG